MSPLLSLVCDGLGSVFFADGWREEPAVWGMRKEEGREENEKGRREGQRKKPSDGENEVSERRGIRCRSDEGGERIPMRRELARRRLEG